MMLDWALKYRRMGLSPIPCKITPAIGKYDKKPLVSWKLYQNSLPTEEEISEWWKRHPNAQLGILTGPFAGLLVLDVEEEGLGLREKFPIPHTWTVKTKRGYHYYFRWPNGLKDVATNRAMIEQIKGFDVRGEGGFLVVPPSTNPDDSRYAWVTRRAPDELPLADCPQWLIDKLSGPVVKSEGPLVPHKSQVDSYLGGVDDGGRYQAFTVMAGFYFGSMRPEMAEKHLKEWNQKNRPPWDTSELDTHIRRFRQKIESGQLQGYQQEEVVQPLEQSIVPFAIDIKRYLEELSHRAKFDKPEFPTGFKALDHATRGFARSNIYVVGAPTGGGKTQFVLAAIHALIEAGKKVLYFSTEMPQEEIRDRFNAIGADIPLDELRKGRLTEDSRTKLVAYLQKADHSNFIISKEDTPSMLTVRATVEEVNPDIIILDHIHHIKMRTDNRRTEIDDFVIGFKKLILERNIPGIVTAQLHRKQPDMKGNIEYTEHDFKESGGIENEAGVCLLLCPPHEWTQERLQNTVMSIRKNRHGRKYQNFSIRFDTVTASFKEHL